MVKIVPHRSFIGTVASAKSALTAIVEVERTVVHPKYGKRYHRTRRLACQNPDNKFSAGDRVKVEECRPLSKTKRWRIVAKV